MYKLSHTEITPGLHCDGSVVPDSQETVTFTSRIIP